MYLSTLDRGNTSRCSTLFWNLLWGCKTLICSWQFSCDRPRRTLCSTPLLEWKLWVWNNKHFCTCRWPGRKKASGNHFRDFSNFYSLMSHSCTWASVIDVGIFENISVIFVPIFCVLHSWFPFFFLPVWWRTTWPKDSERLERVREESVRAMLIDEPHSLFSRNDWFLFFSFFSFFISFLFFPSFFFTLAVCTVVVA